jgi:hypothetical protein
LRITLHVIASKKVKHNERKGDFTLRTQREEPMKLSVHCVLTLASLRLKKGKRKVRKGDFTLRTQREKPIKPSVHCVLTIAPLRQKKSNAKYAMVVYAKNPKRRANET